MKLNDRLDRTERADMRAAPFVVAAVAAALTTGIVAYATADARERARAERAERTVSHYIDVQVQQLADRGW